MPCGQWYVVNYLSRVRHAGTDFCCESWAACTNGDLIYVDSIIQLSDGAGATTIMMKMFCFSLKEQLCATGSAGLIRVRLARMLQLLRLRREAFGDSPAPNVSVFPCPELRGRSEEGMWDWSWAPLADWVSAADVEFRPVHFAGLDPAEVELRFVYR